MLEKFSLENKPWFRKKIIGLIILIVGLVAVLEIWTVNRLATVGEQLSNLETIKISLSTENELLENQIAEKASLSHLSEQAVSEGFRPIRDVAVVKKLDIALNQ